MFKNILKRFGYLKVDYGFSCGRHWIKIDDKIICQANCDVYLKDEDVHRIGYFILDNGKYWRQPDDPTFR